MKNSRKHYTIVICLCSLLLAPCSVIAQTLNVQVGNVTYQFPAAQAGEMTYSNGTILTVMGKAFTLTDVSRMFVDETEVTDSKVSVVYAGSSASIAVAGNIAKDLTITQSGAHVSIAQSDALAQEVTYTLSGSTSDGEFYTTGSYKASVELNGLNLTNTTPVYSGAAVHVQNGKRINVRVITGTTNTLSDAATGSQKGALYIKGHAEFKQYGTLNVYGNLKHGIKAGEYIQVKNATINVLAAKNDGINCSQYFLMQSGSITISGVGDDGIQCDVDNTPTGQTTDHEGEDSGNIYILDGTLDITVTASGAKALKAEGEVYVTGGTIKAKATGNGLWDTTDMETKSASCISADGNMVLSGGTLTLTSTGSGGKAIKCDGTLTISGNVTIIATTTGGLFYSNGTTTNTNYTGNTDRISNSYYSSPKGIKAVGAIYITGGKVFVTTGGRNAEGIESKSTIDISGGEVAVTAYDDAINAASHLTITDGLVYACATNNDGLDANGNCYIKGGVIYAIGASSPEVGVDANTEGGYKLYVTGGTIIAIGGMERGASLTQSCYSTGSSSGGGGGYPGGGPGGGGSSSSWSKNTWYAMTYGDSVLAFKTPSSGGSSLVVSASSTPTLKSGITVSEGTLLFDGAAYNSASVTGGSSVTLSSYSGNSGGGPGGW